MTAVQDRARPEVRTYGGWRRRRGIGLGNLDGRQSLLVIGAALMVLIAAVISIPLALVMLAPAGLLIGVALAHWDGVWATDAAIARLRFARAARAAATSYRAGVVVDHPRAWQLPGVLATLRCLDVEDGQGGSFGAVWDRRTGLMTAVLSVAATGTSLADESSADSWVANWGGWLAALGDEPAVCWAAVSIDTAPDPGNTLHDHIENRIDPSSPIAARELLRQLVAASPAASANVDTRVAVTFDTDKAPSRPAGLREAAAEVSRTLFGLSSALGGCGLSVLGRASAAEIAGAVRTAFDPNARGQVKAELGRIAAGAEPAGTLDWGSAGPVAAEELWDSYLHDSAASVTWALRDAPRQQVTSNVLARVIGPGTWPRRVTMTYQVFPSEQAAKVVESERNAAAFRAAYRQRTKRDETAREVEDRARADRAAAEESQGAGVVLWSTYITTTVTDPRDLPAAVADVEQRAGTAKLRLRRMYGSQAAGFAATLPCGIYPPFLSHRGRR